MNKPAPSNEHPSAPTFGNRLGHPRVHLRRTGSTNDRARELALRGAPSGTLVTAEEQTAGRGRHGRRWSAPPRSALLMSLLLRWSASERAPALLPLAAAVAVCEVVGPQALVKWPNDVVIRRQTSGLADIDIAVGVADSCTSPANPRGRHANLAKLAGILIEGRPQERWLVLGIGVNVAIDTADLPADVRNGAATLGMPPEAVEPVLGELLAALELNLSQTSDAILAAWRSRDALLGSHVSWPSGDGMAEGVSERGGLLVRRRDGSIVELDSGEVLPAPQ